VIGLLSVARQHSRTPPKICRSLGREGPSKKALNWGSLDGKSLVLLRLPACKAKAYLLKTRLFPLTPSSVLHPPLPYQHFTALFLSYNYTNRFVPTTHLHIATRATASSGLLPARHSRDHTYIHPVLVLLLRLGASCGNTLPCA